MSDGDVQLQRDIGRMEGDISALRQDVAEMKADVKILTEAMSQLKGGTRTLLGVAAVIGAVVSWVIHLVVGKLP
jgi:hypothetical protein